MLIALDIATTTGCAWGGPKDGCPTAARWQLSTNLDRAMAQLRQTVASLCEKLRPELVAIEKPLIIVDREHGARIIEVLMSLAAVAAEAATRNGAHVQRVDVRTWRKTYLGSGNLSREEAKAACLARCRQLGWPVPYQDDNAAEAMGLFYHCAANRWPLWRPSGARVKDAVA